MPLDGYEHTIHITRINRQLPICCPWRSPCRCVTSCPHRRLVDTITRRKIRPLQPLGRCPRRCVGIARDATAIDPIDPLGWSSHTLSASVVFDTPPICPVRPGSLGTPAQPLSAPPASAQSRAISYPNGASSTCASTQAPINAIETATNNDSCNYSCFSLEDISTAEFEGACHAQGTRKLAAQSSCFVTEPKRLSAHFSERRWVVRSR